MQALKVIAGLFVAAIAAISLVLWLFVAKPINDALAPATPDNARKDMMPERTDAVILMPFVTGDVPRLVRGDALAKWSKDLWFTSNFDAGNVVGAILLGMGGMPPTTDIGTAFEAETPLERFSCITVGCVNWPRGETELWGLLPLRGLGAELGPEVRLDHASFTDYAAYRAAHEAVSGDPLRWFAEPGSTVPQPDSDGTRLVVITLPSRLMPISPSVEMPAENPALADELRTFASRLIDGLDGRVEGIDGTAGMPLWVARDDDYLRDDDGGTLSLPRLAVADPVVRLRVKAEAVGIVRGRLDAVALPPPDLDAIPSAVANAYAGWGIDAACLPNCGGVIPSTPFRDETEMNVSGEPFWSLSFWHVPPE